MENMEAMRREWETWLATGESVKELGFDSWDDPKLKKLHAQIVLWSEQLAALRVKQDVTIRADALHDALQRLARS